MDELDYYLYNNCTIALAQPTADAYRVKVNCPKLGSGDLLHNTNSHFAKIQNIVDYNWQIIPQVNWLTIHRDQPLIAYVINPSYVKSLVRNSQPDPASQIVRILNFKDRTLGMCKRPFSATIADLAFSYNSASRKQDVLISTIDVTGEVCVFSFRLEPSMLNTRSVYEVTTLLVVNSSELQSLNHFLTLNWCPYVSAEDEEEEEDSDPGLRLVTVTDKHIELFSLDKLIHDTNKVELERSQLDPEKGYQLLSNVVKSPIIKISLSNDATTVCSVSADNQINFFHVGSSVELIHNWCPKLSTGDRIAHFHFLDDYNKLLEDTRYSFWGYAFIGTANGEISIWDLKNWAAIQRIQIECEEFDSVHTSFRYRVDISAHVLTAISGNVAFIFQIEFDEEGDLPHFTKVTRFQLYNQILSFACNKGPGDEIDVFWLTAKSLERCTLDGSLLTDDSVQDSRELLLASASETRIKQSDINSLLCKIPDLSLNTSNKNMTLSSLFNTSQSASQQPSNTSSAVKNLFASAKQDSVSCLKPPTPTSEEVANLLKNANSSCLENLHPPSVELGNIKYVSEIEPNTPIAESTPYVAAISRDDLTAFSKNLESAIEQQQAKQEELFTQLSEKNLASLEWCVRNELVGSQMQIANDVRKITQQVEELRKEPPAKLNTKVLDGFLKRLMDQLNSLLTKGLNEFLGQVRTECAELCGAIVKMQEQYKLEAEERNKELGLVRLQMGEMSKQLNEFTKQQQILINQMQSANTSMRTTPAQSPIVGKVMTASSLLQSNREAEDRKRREDITRNIWSRIRSGHSENISKGFSMALDLKEESLLTDILKEFIANPSDLVNHLKENQIILLSLLNQLTLHTLSRDSWKVKFISEIVASLDIKMPVIRSNLKLFIDKLIHKISELEKNGEERLMCHLLLNILNSYKKQL